MSQKKYNAFIYLYRNLASVKNHLLNSLFGLFFNSSTSKIEDSFLN